jgi:hypothetical protein
MLRFKPDSWVDGLLRPLLLADPSKGIYFEDSAPDARFLALVVVLLVAFTIGRGRALASPRQRQALWMLAVVFYVWTLSIGNGRYFIVGLLMVGPLLVMAWQWLPGSRTLRGLLLLGFVGLQWQTVQSMYRPGSWLLAGWRSGPSVVLEDTPLQRAPAVFLTLSSNGYGALVPRFHAQSRWVNLGHQMVIGPGQPEYKDVRALLTAPLPKYLVAPADPPKGSQVAQPSEGLRQRLNQDLHHHQLALADELCSMVRSNLLSKSLTDSDRAPSARAFWICPLRAESSPVPPTTKPDEATLAAFSSVEAHCPRFFPSGQGITRRDEGQWLRYYPSTDFHAYLDDTGYVSYKYFLSYSAVTIGTAEDVRAGRLQLDCARPRGRYRPPWVTD